MRIEINPDCRGVDVVVLDEKKTVRRGETVTITKAQWENIHRLSHRGRRILRVVPPKKTPDEGETMPDEGNE